MLSCFFIIFGVVALINLSISIRDTDIILDRLLVYFACQAKGYNADNTCSAEYNNLEMVLKPELNTATYFLLGLVPWSNFLFVIQVSDIKKAIHKVKIMCHDSNRGSRTYTLSTSVTQ